jgi:hypothetical protein
MLIIFKNNELNILLCIYESFKNNYILFFLIESILNQNLIQKAEACYSLYK